MSELRISQAWLGAPETVRVLDAIEAGGGEARFVGGSVRNALLGAPVADIDIATNVVPDEVDRRLRAAGIASHPTGIAHGTITAVANHKPFEITTLRRDVSTDGRRATVAFTTDWAEDAQRRDFTINALYARRDGTVVDLVGGAADIAARRIRFIGTAADRIREDYLRILRFFRFHAWYGRGELDREGLAACAALKDGIATLSGERIHAELLKLLGAPDPVPALRQMAAAGILGDILPGELDIARLAKLVEIETTHLFSDGDALLRLGALIAGGPEGRRDALISRLRLSNAERDRLKGMDRTDVKIVSYLSIREVRRALYKLMPAVFKDLVMLRWAADPKANNATQWRALLALADSWARPVMDLSGHDVRAAGVPDGPEIGRVLAEVEEWWIDSDFTDDKFSLIERLKAVVQATIR
ncbi:MAG: CCA tRNA nucleotidyltransferase [Alphaproteobacteria bacterium]|nr:CCA tRNA nucleotidyltransferase [Alphaproteobacteria bacterium]